MKGVSIRTTERAKLELKRLIALFESGDIPDAISKVVLTSKGMPSSRWTLSNRLLAFAQTLEIDCRGYRQWQQVNRQVKKGAKAAYILRPHTIKKENEETKEEEILVIGFGCLPVFPYSSTEGEPLPELHPGEPPPLIDVAEKFGIAVDYQMFAGLHYGAYSSSSSKIVLCTHDEQVFFHELAHAAHEKVLAKRLKGGQDPKQEIVAEMASYVLARLYGRKQSDEGSTYRYIQRYARDMKKDLGVAIVSVLSDVEKVLTLVIETSEMKEAV